MMVFKTKRFVGADEDHATELMMAAMQDGSFPVLMLIERGIPLAMWMTHEAVIPGAMQQSTYILHVTALMQPSETSDAV